VTAGVNRERFAVESTDILALSPSFSISPRRNRQIFQQKARDRFFSHDGYFFLKGYCSIP
jgi:hypothetical protein